MAKRNTQVNRKAEKIVKVAEEVAQEMVLEAVMDLMERQYSVAKDTKRTEYVLTDKADKKSRITVRGAKDSWTFISNKEHIGWEYHDRKHGSWWGKALKANEAKEYIKLLTAQEVQLG